MTFLERDEYLVVMDMNVGGRPEVSLTFDEMSMLKGAGVKTIYYQAALRWDVMQPAEGAPLDWSAVDRCVNDARRAGLKVLIPFVYAFPRWWPDELLYSREVNGDAYGIPNYTSAETTARVDDFLAQTMKRYHGDDVQVIFSVPANGEFPLHIWPVHGKMDYPMADFVQWVIDRQRIMAEPHGEVWSAYHPYCNPEWWEPVYGAMFSEFPYAAHYGIIFTYVQHGQPHVRQLIGFNQHNGPVTYYAGTEYMQGIRPNLPKLMAGGVRMLTAPKHHYQQFRAIEDWMLHDIEWAIEQYGASQ